MTDVMDSGSDAQPDAPSTTSTRSARRQQAKATDALQSQVYTAFRAAKAYTDSSLAPARIKAQDAYHGEPYGDEEPGRSQVIDRTIRDTVRVYMPSLMRIFFGGRTVVEYLPQKPVDTDYAQQATDFINQVVVQQDNPGYLIHQAAFKDALVLRTGWFKWWWDTKRDVRSYHYTGLTESEVQLLGTKEHVRKIKVAKDESNPLNPVFEVWLTLDRPTTAKTRFACVPNEEILYTPGSTKVDDVLAFFHSRTDLTVGDLVAMGYDYTEVLEHAMPSEASSANIGTGTAQIERQSRMPDAVLGSSTGLSDPLMRHVRYTEAYTFKDMDNDEYAELLKVCAVGDTQHVVAWEPTDEIPFSYITPDPEPHEIGGESVTDITKDIQRIKTAAQRFMLDAFSQSVMPGWEAVEGQVDLDDLLNTEIGRVVRVKQPGMLRELVPTATGQQMLGVLTYFDQVRDGRTKQTAMSQGLDGNQLQSTEKAAAASQLTAAAADQEMIARNMGETGIKRLYLGLLTTTIKHQDKPRTVLLNGKWVDVNPSVWDAGMQVQINIGLGASAVEERKALLEMVMAKQELIIGQAGLSNPLAGANEYRNTLEDYTVLLGRKDATRYFKVVPPDYQPPTPPTPPDPATIVAQSTERIKAQELAWQQKKETVDLALQHDDNVRQDQTKRLQIEATYRSTIYAAEISAKMTGEQSRIDAETERMGQILEAHSTNQASAAGMIAQMHGNVTDAATQQQLAAQQPPAAPSGASA